MSTRSVIVGIAGGSGSGKSSLARAVVRLLPAGSAGVLALDSYHRDRSGEPGHLRGLANFDEPAAIDAELLLEHVRALARGEVARAPEYDFRTHERMPTVQLVEPRPWLLVEGLFALHWAELRGLMGLKVFVDLDIEICRERRLRRDVAERGRTLDSASDQFERTVRPMHARHVQPTSKHADLVVSGEAPLERSASVVLQHLTGACAVGGSAR